MVSSLVACIAFVCISCSILTVQAIQGCPSDKCSCESLSKNAGEPDSLSAQCSRQGLREVPDLSSLPSSVHSIDLSFNFITKITNLSFTNTSQIDLHSNGIATLQPRVFSSLSGLEFLDLSNNKIQALNESALDGLKNLKVLNLSSNSISVLEDHIFRDLSNLEVLRLSDNPLKFVVDKWFEKKAKLKYLDLTRIRAYSLSDSVFRSLTNLQVLDLSNNDFETVPSKALRSAVSLKVLHFKDNPVKELDSESFHRLYSLEEVFLRNLRFLQEIKKGTFEDLKYLTILDISHNPKLSAIHVDAFGEPGSRGNNSVSLKELSLDHNDLRHLQISAFSLCSVDTLDLRGNPWQCDCKLSWVRKCQLKPELTVDFSCMHPLEHHGKLVADIPEEEFTCLMKSPSIVGKEAGAPIRLIVIAAGVLSILILVSSVVAMLKKEDIQDWYQNRKKVGSVYYVKAQSHANPVQPTDV